MVTKKIALLLMSLSLFAISSVFVQSKEAKALSKNLALNKPVTASGNEVEWLIPENAVDGDAKTRWSSVADDDQWLYVDLGKKRKIARVVIDWQTPAETYTILISNDKENWVNVVEDDGILTAAANGKDTVEFDQTEARYVKFQGVERRAVEGVLYGYSIAEFEVYEDRDFLPIIMDELRENIEIKKGQKRVKLPFVRKGYKASLIGSDRVQVIDNQGNIKMPLVNAQAQLLVRAESKSDPDEYVIDNILVDVPGQHSQTEDLNPEPDVIPSIREWLGGKGDLTLTNSSKIIVNPKDQQHLQKVAEITQSDVKAATDLMLDIAYGTPESGDIYLSIDDSLSDLGEEGYMMEINDYISMTSVDPQGVFYGTRTLLQIIMQDDSYYIPKGLIRDYPKYTDRGFMLDVARKFYTIDFLRDYIKQMSFYKMNRLQIHLNDNVGTPFPNGKKSAFRLESEKYPGLASEDGYYTKEEFRELQQLGMEYGINVVPEIDTPGHSGAFVDFDPSLGKDGELDITKPETVNFVKELFNEYIDGDHPTFIGPDVHIGTDEYWGGNVEIFRKYTDTLIKHINSKGKHPRLWGGLTMYDGDTSISNDATMDIWYVPYGGPQQAIDLGYDIVNVNTNQLYIVPQLYQDYLNVGYFYESWEPNQWDDTVLPFGHPKLKGAMFAFWNDVSVEKGLSMADSHHRILPAMQVLTEKMWSGMKGDRSFHQFEDYAAQIGDAPNVHLSHEMETKEKNGEVLHYLFEGNLKDSTENGFDANGKNVEYTDGIFGQGMRVNGGKSYIQTPLRSLGFNWTLSMWIKPDKDNPNDAVLMESPEGQLKLTQGETEKLGFSKEGYDSVFDYKMSPEQWTHLLLTGDSEGTTLFVNGSEYTQSLNKVGGKLETFILPLEIIGGRSNGFKGVIDNVKIYNTTFNLHGNLALNKMAESSQPEASTYTPDKAVDGKGDTRWSSEYVDDAWFLVDLDEVTKIDKVTINWQTAYGKKYKILVSEDKEQWTNVTQENDGIIMGKGGREEISFDPIKARYVKFQGIERETIFGYSFSEFEVFNSENKIGNKSAIKNRMVQIQDENLNKDKYTEESWQALYEALQATEKTLNKVDATQAELDQQLSDLNTAHKGLKYKSPITATSMIERVELLHKEGHFKSEDAVQSLTIHLSSVHHYEEKMLVDKVIKHMKGFQILLKHQKDSELVSEEAYQLLKRDADELLDK
ncbi:discoidin domain-containing protein [Bacillus sp. SD088]|uniref:discoidin domain-containing protein n=1 Tax=Bacillus sp. SD088 TaxID=2782012 RepID=UPI001A977F05|nr:discoidin domain-containing protein [Bacillus sp. SD088]MBO0991763.1 discoidin domain-containing protein [Bacillus sp. SD088]